MSYFLTFIAGGAVTACAIFWAQYTGKFDVPKVSEDAAKLIDKAREQ